LPVFFSAQNTKTGKNMPNDHKMYQMAIKIPFGRKIDKKAIKIPTSSTARPCKIYPNCEFWFENIPSGNTGIDTRSLWSGSTPSHSRYVKAELLKVKQIVLHFSKFGR
jgi:hypothetical protein